MSLYSEPPPLHTFSQDKPTLLVCWWITIFCTVIILLRVGGRFVRTEKLFREDKVAALALIPLFLRMGCVHVILMYGTNNAQLADAGLSDEILHQKSIASGLVLLSRVFYAATLWVLKSAILEFFNRLNVNWERSYEVTLLFIRCALVATFIAVVISDLAECQPFSHYWQVLPDPGGRCRQGYAQLLTMAVCNVTTDLLLVFFPVPIIIRSQMSAKRKVQLVLLFSLSLAVVAVTLYRVPHIIEDRGSQQSRSLYASVELLFATAAANALVLGSFVRDRGVKKNRYKYGSVAAGSMEGQRSSVAASESRRPTIATRHWGSDEDLVRDVGYGVKPDLREMPSTPASPMESSSNQVYTPAPMANLDGWKFPGNSRRNSAEPRGGGGGSGNDFLKPGVYVPATRSSSNATSRKVSFFDYGGLLNDQNTPGGRRESQIPPNEAAIPSPSIPASSNGLRRGSTALLQDIGGLLSPLSAMSPRSQRSMRSGSTGTELQHMQQEERPSSKSIQHGTPPSYNRSDSSSGRPEPVLMDPGGLLGNG